MAIMKFGILGNTSGCIGSVEGARWKGRDVYKARKRKSFIPASNSQLVHRSSFALCRHTLSNLRALLEPYGYIQGSKSLPFWPTWIKETSSSFAAGFDVYGQTSDIMGGSYYERAEIVSSTQNNLFGSSYFTFVVAGNRPNSNAILRGVLVDIDTFEVLDADLVYNYPVSSVSGFISVGIDSGRRLVAWVWWQHYGYNSKHGKSGQWSVLSI